MLIRRVSLPDERRVQRVFSAALWVMLLGGIPSAVSTGTLSFWLSIPDALKVLVWIELVGFGASVLGVGRSLPQVSVRFRD